MAGTSRPPVSAAALRDVVARILVGAGSTPQEADQVAANLVLANLSGHDSHGVGMLPRYVDAVRFVNWVRAGPVAPGFESVLLAGDPERAARAQREVHGIDIDDRTWAELVAAGNKVDVVIAAR